MKIKTFWNILYYIAFLGIGIVTGISGITVRTWQFYVLLACIVIVYISGISHGKTINERKTK